MIPCVSDLAQNASYLNKSHLIHSVKLHKDGGVCYLRMGLAFEMMLSYFELRLERHVVRGSLLSENLGGTRGAGSVPTHPQLSGHCPATIASSGDHRRVAIQDTDELTCYLIRVSFPSEPFYPFLFLVNFSWFAGVPGRTGPQFSSAVNSSIKKSWTGLYPSLFHSSQSLSTIAFLSHLFPEKAMCMKDSAFGGAQADSFPAEFLVRLMNELFQTKPDKWVIGEIVRSVLRHCLMGHFFCFVFFFFKTALLRYSSYNIQVNHLKGKSIIFNVFTELCRHLHNFGIFSWL